METRTLAEVRAADADTLYSLYFPEGRVSAAAAVGCVCVCVDYLTCSECERILGQSFLEIELALRKKQRTDPPVPAARVEIEIRKELGKVPGPGSHGVEWSDAVVSAMADRLVPGSHTPSDGVEDSNAGAGMADRLVSGSYPPSDGVEGSDAAARMADRLVPSSYAPADGVEGSDTAISSKAGRLGPSSHPHGIEGLEAGISSMAARLGLPAAVVERAKDVFTKMGEANAWPYGPGRSKDQSKGTPSYVACLSIACRTEGSAPSLRELVRAAAADGGAVAKKDIVRLVAHIRRQLGEEEAGQATGIKIACASSYVRRFGALVGLGESEAAAALEAARRLDEGALDVRHTAESVAAALVCLALKRAGAVRKHVKAVTMATGIASATIIRVCRSLRPHADILFG